MNIAFLDDHKLFSEILADFVNQKFPAASVSNFDSASAFLSAAKNELFDICVLDLEMPEMSGVEVIRKLQDIYKEPRVIVLSMYYNVQIASELLKLNVRSFLPKNVDIRDFEKALKQVHKGELYYQEELIKRMAEEVDRKVLLTRRELEIINLSAAGNTSKQIAATIFVSEETVRTHIKNIMSKTGYANFKEVIANYQKEGWEVLT